MKNFIFETLMMVPLALAKRVQIEEAQVLSAGTWTSAGDDSKFESSGARELISADEWMSQSLHGANIGHGDFACPWFCSECCKDYRSLTGLVRDYLLDRSQFRCTFPQHEAHLLDNVTFQEQALHGRQCTQAAADPADEHVWEVFCKFTEEEREASAWRDLPDCHLDPSVVSYATWLGPDSCSVTSFGAMLARASGQEWFGFVDLGIRAVVSHNPLVVCRAKASQFKSLNSTTTDDVRGEICPQLTHDIDHSRMDPFNMAFWAMGTGELARVETFPKPRDEARILQKHTIPGWPARTVAYESMPEDPKPINLYNGAVQCMMRRLRREYLHDDVMSEEKNNYGRSEEDPQAPRFPADVRTAYFDNYLQFQPQGTHFDVPANELLTDETTAKLVFQSIGAHRVEIIPADGSVAVDLSFITLGGCAGVPAGNGCPNPLNDALASLPSPTRRDARYVVRMEGLYDDLPVRHGLARWGGNAYFDEAGRLLAIQHKGETKLPVDAAWNYFKYVFRSSLLGTVTVVDHLVGCHILMAETLAISTYETLGPTDYLRLLLAPHTYGSLQINSVAAMTLFAGNMQVHRTSPFGRDAFEPRDGSTGGIWAKTVVLRLRPFQEIYNAYLTHRNTAAHAPEMPFFEDGILMYSALKRYVSAFINEAFGATPVQCDQNLGESGPTKRFVAKFFAETDPATPDFWPQEMRNAGSSCESLKALLTESIFAVSGIHRHVGSVSDFYRDLTFAGTAWPEGEAQPRPKQGFLTLLLAAATNFFGPKLQDAATLTHMFEDKPGVLHVFESLIEDLTAVQIEVESRNQRRLAEGNLAFHQMEPKYVEWGVMI